MWLSNKSLGLLCLVGFVVSVGCSASSGTGTDGNVGGAGGDGNSGQGNNGNGGDGGGFIPPTGSGGGGGGPIDDCSDAAKLVYVLGADNFLYSFNPPAKKFLPIGPLNCNTPLSPNSMAVDRNAVAWVNYVAGNNSTGQIFKVSTKDATCEPAATVQLSGGWTRMGMGYSSNGANTMEETLFVSGRAGTGLGKINTMNQLNPIAPYSPQQFSSVASELTGTGDGRLYGYFVTNPVQLGEIDKTSGAVINPKTITGLNNVFSFAFSFWGGSFYLYAAGSGGNSNVTKYDPVANTIDNAYMTQVGITIVGAGVSTCAPLVEPPPK
jgi:hypothetical protein